MKKRNEIFYAIAFCADGSTITVEEDFDLCNILSHSPSFVNSVKNGRIIVSGNEYVIKRIIVIQEKNACKLFWDSDRIPDVLIDQV